MGEHGQQVWVGCVCWGCPRCAAAARPDVTYTVPVPFLAALPARAGAVLAPFRGGVPTAQLPWDIPRGLGEGRAGDPAAPLAGTAPRAAGDQARTAAVREPQERDAGELHPAQVRGPAFLLFLLLLLLTVRATLSLTIHPLQTGPYFPGAIASAKGERPIDVRVV